MCDNFTEQNSINVGFLRYNDENTGHIAWMTSTATF